MNTVWNWPSFDFHGFVGGDPTHKIFQQSDQTGTSEIGPRNEDLKLHIPELEIYFITFDSNWLEEAFYESRDRLGQKHS